MAVRRGFVKNPLFFFRIQVIFPRNTAKFSLNFWPAGVHEKPSFRYAPSAFFAKKKNNKHKQLLGLSQERVAVRFVYVLPFSLGERETHEQNSREISGKRPRQSRDNPGTIPWNCVHTFSCFLGLSGPNRSVQIFGGRFSQTEIHPVQNWGLEMP